MNEEKLIDVCTFNLYLAHGCARDVHVEHPFLLETQRSRQLFGFLKLTFSRKPQVKESKIYVFEMEKVICSYPPYYQ